MKKQNFNKKLFLSKETITNLNQNQMSDAKGGINTTVSGSDVGCFTFKKGCDSELPAGTVCCQVTE